MKQYLQVLKSSSNGLQFNSLKGLHIFIQTKKSRHRDKELKTAGYWKNLIDY